MNSEPDDRRLFDDLRSEAQPEAPMRSIETRAKRIRRRRTAIPVALGAVAIVLVAAIGVFATRDDNGQVHTTNNPPGTTEGAPTTSRPGGATSTTATDETTTTLAAPITFDARMVERDGARFLEIQFTSEPPPGMALWAVTVNGRIWARTNHASGQGTFGTNVTSFGQPISVTVIAEDADRNVIAESERVVVSL